MRVAIDFPWLFGDAGSCESSGELQILVFGSVLCSVSVAEGVAVNALKVM
jgi:hypothetical protein